MKKRTWYSLIVSAILFFGIMFCLKVALGEQQLQTIPPSAAPSAQSQSAPYANQNIIRVEVPIVTVDVVVTDKKGRPIKGLMKEDFRVFEDGVAQTITNFEYISEDEPTTQLASITSDRPLGPQRRNYILFLFDNSTLDAAGQEKARQAAIKFIDVNLREGDFVAIAQYRNAMQIVQNFTDSKRRLGRALGVISPAESPESTDTGNTTAPNPLLDRAQQNLRALGAAFDARNLMIAMRGLFNSMRNVKGRKSLIVFSGGLSLSAENSLDLFSAIDAANKANVTVYTIDAKGLTADFPATTPGLRRTSFNFQPQLPNLGLFVNSFQGQRGGGGDSRGGTGGGGTGGPTGGGGGRTGGGWSGGSGGGTRTPSGGSPTGGRGSGNNPNAPNPLAGDPYANRSLGERRLDQLSLNELKDVLLTMATETGGFYIRNSNDFNKGLQDIKSEMRNYYSLGYESNNKVHDGKFRAIKVELQKKGLNAKYRKGYFDQKSLDVLAGTPAETPLAKAIEEAAPITTLPLRLVCDYFYEGPGQARAPVAVQLPISKLKFKKDKGLRSDSIDILGIAFREDGTKAARFSDAVTFRMDNDQLKKLPEDATLSIPNYFKLEPGKYRVKIALHDQGDSLGTVEENIQIPEFKSGEFAVSSLVMSGDVRPVSSLMNHLESQLLDEKNPLIFNGMKIYQSVDRKFYQDRPVALFFTLYNPSIDPKQNKPNLLLSYSILAENKIVFQLPLSRLTETASPENGALPVGLSIPLNDLPPQSYTVQVMVRDALTNATRYVRDRFEVQAPPQK